MNVQFNSKTRKKLKMLCTQSGLAPYWHLLEAIHAGKTIQTKSGGKWRTIAEPNFTSPPSEYRIKPELCPLTFEEVKAKLKLPEVYLLKKTNNLLYRLTKADEGGVWICPYNAVSDSCGTLSYTYREFMEYFSFCEINVTEPCGKE